MKKLQFILLGLASSALTAHAATSFLLVQGDFGASGAFTSQEWQVNYNSGALTTGQDLLNSVFGAPVDTGTKNSSNQEIYASGNSLTGVHYALSPSFGLLLVSFTLMGTTITPNYNADTSYWGYGVAGGGGTYGSNFSGAPYSSGSWTFANDGAGTRTLADGSFDAWFVANDTSATYSPTGVSPSTTDFSNATVVSAPEPASLFLVGGAFTVGALRRRRLS